MALNPFTQAEFLELWKKLLPGGYVEPIVQSEAGLDIPSAHAAIWARVEQALNVSQQAYYLRPHSTQTGPVASGPRKATGTVEITRLAPALGDLVIGLGTSLMAEELDSFGATRFLGRYFTTAEATLPEGTLGPVTVPVEAEFPGYTGDQRAGVINRFEDLGRLEVAAVVASTTQFERAVPATDETDRFEQGMVGRYVRLVGVLASENRNVPRRVIGTFLATDGQLGIEVDLALDPADVGALIDVEVEELGDIGLRVSQPAPITGGAADALGAIATDRRVGRVAGESDERFRARLQELADVVSPASHIRILDRIFGSAGIPFEYLEASDPESLMGFTWGVHPWGFGSLELIPKPTGSELVGQGIVWLGAPRNTRFFLVIVDASGLGEFGMPWGSASYPPGYPNAWGVGIWGSGGALGFLSLVAQAWAELNAARAGGVGFLITLRQ